jgi:predicted YcjX-like family ATPase
MAAIAIAIMEVPSPDNFLFNSAMVGPPALDFTPVPQQHHERQQKKVNTAEAKWAAFSWIIMKYLVSVAFSQQITCR